VTSTPAPSTVPAARSWWFAATLLFCQTLLACSTAPAGPRGLDLGSAPSRAAHAHASPDRNELGIRWFEGGLDAARVEAKSQGKSLFVFVSTVWCGPCKRMKELAFIDKALARRMNDALLPVMVDGDVGEGKALCESLRVNSYPTMLFFEPRGSEIDRAFGYHDARQMERVISDMLADRNTVADLRRRVDAAPGSLALRQSLGLRLALRGETDDAVKELEAVIRADPENAQGQAAQAMFTIGRYVHFLKTRDFDAAIRHLGQLLSQFPASPQAREAAVDLVRLRMMRGQRDLAIAALEAMLAGQPAEAQRYIDAAQAVQQHGLPLERAAEWLAHAATLRGDALPLFLLGKVQELRQDTPSAIDAYRRALERSPNDGASKQALERLEKATPPKASSPKAPAASKGTML